MGERSGVHLGKVEVHIPLGSTWAIVEEGVGMVGSGGEVD